MTKEELIQQIKPYMYCYMGSGMLTNDYDDEVATKSAEKVLEIVSKSLEGDKIKLFLENNGWTIILDKTATAGSVHPLSKSWFTEHPKWNYTQK